MALGGYPGHSLPSGLRGRGDRRTEDAQDGAEELPAISSPIHR
jgi:hypothetical protein